MINYEQSLEKLEKIYKNRHLILLLLFWADIGQIWARFLPSKLRIIAIVKLKYLK